MKERERIKSGSKSRSGETSEETFELYADSYGEQVFRIVLSILKSIKPDLLPGNLQKLNRWCYIHSSEEHQYPAICVSERVISVCLEKPVSLVDSSNISLLQRFSPRSIIAKRSVHSLN
jgi:hypothetical protein